MNDVRSFFAPQRARPEPPAAQPAPERRAAESTGADFAKSLASVRGLERSAAGQARAAVARNADRANDRADERADVRADDPASLVRSRAQVQALMLSGAMKFAATRTADATPTTTCAPTVKPADFKVVMIAGNPIAEVVVADSTMIDDLTVPADVMTDLSDAFVPDVGAVVAADVATNVAADVAVNTAPAATVTDTFEPIDFSAAPQVIEAAASIVTPAADEPAIEADVVVVDESATDISSTPAATAAAMQLLATLPIFDVPAPLNVANDTPTPSTESNTDDAARAAWEARMAAQAMPTEVPALVEDHFDAPASATVDAVRVPTSADAWAESLPSNVTMTFADTMTAVSEAALEIAPASTVAAPITVAGGVVHAVERDVAQLSPEFRERLQRVMDRMKQEFGHDVTVVETVRSQARQAALYAQGRTTPGPVVTWTRNSKHSKGLAADLMVDGQWDNPAGYAHLAQIAKQEGLRTLGARDPGHVELPVDGNVSAETLGSLLGDLAGDAGDNARQVRAELDSSDARQSATAMARVAEVAQVARVAQVAQVARVASVARPGASSAPAESHTGDNVSPLAVTSPMPQMMTDGSAAVRLTAPVSSVNMADRISHLMDLQASQSARPLNSVLLRMDNANGIEDQIRIDTRGTSVDAQLGLGSAQQAADLSSRVSELREALERRGLTADGVRVQASPRTTDSVQFTRMAAPALDVAAMRAGADAQAQSDAREQAARDHQREALARQQDRPTPRSSSDDARHRSRREQPETRQ